MQPIAQPNDPDLDCELQGLRVVTFTHLSSEYGEEFSLLLNGGFGRWRSSESGMMVDVDTVTDMELGFGWDLAQKRELIADKFLDFVFTRLNRWAGNKTPLYFIAAPSKMSLLYESPTVTIPIPRSTPPDII